MNKTYYEEVEPGKMILRDHLAYDRTVLANERTFLAYVRTAIALVATGCMLIKVFGNHIEVLYAGYGLIVIGVFTSGWGIRRYKKVWNKIKRAYVD